MKTEQPKPGTHALRGVVTEQELTSPKALVKVQRSKESRHAWSTDSREGAGAFVVLQTVTQKPVSKPGRLALVIDGSQGMEKHFASVAAAIENLPPGMELMLLMARDGVEELSDGTKTGEQLARNKLVERLGKFRAVGGHDNVPALVRAWDFAAGSSNGIVVWIHGSQPLLLDAAEQLRQRFERRPGSVELFEVQTELGPNRVIEKLDGLNAVKRVTLASGLGEDLKKLFKFWSNGSTKLELVRERKRVEEVVASGRGNESSLHLARLWAADEVSKLVMRRQITEATRLASAYHLVTSVSGAVVLETKAQFERAGLTPVPPETVPTVPEPSAAILLLIGGIVFAANRYWHRNLSSRLLRQSTGRS